MSALSGSSGAGEVALGFGGGREPAHLGFTLGPAIY